MPEDANREVYPTDALCRAIAQVDALPVNPDTAALREYLYQSLEHMLPPPIQVALVERRGISGYPLHQLRAFAEMWKVANWR